MFKYVRPYVLTRHNLLTDTIKEEIKHVCIVSPYF